MQTISIDDSLMLAKVYLSPRKVDDKKGLDETLFTVAKSIPDCKITIDARIKTTKERSKVVLPTEVLVFLEREIWTESSVTMCDR